MLYIIVIRFFLNIIGQFGKIYKATYVQDTSVMTVAVKIIKKYESDQETSDFLHEMRITMDLTHPNIIHLYGIVDEGTLCHSEYIHLNSNYRDNNPYRAALAGIAVLS